MSSKVIPFGYSAPNAWDQLQALMTDSRTMLVDIRESVKSERKPEWSGDSLQAKYGRQYLWIRDLGNLNYYRHDAPIQIRNIDTGLARLVNGLQKGYTLILLCTCSQYESCHRRVVVEALQVRMPDVEVAQPEPSGDPNTIKCISVRQPYASWLVHPEKFLAAGIPPKTIENRDWTTRYRGPLLIHAGKTFENEAIDYWWSHMSPDLDQAVSFEKSDYPRGAIVGIAELVDVVEESDDPWFVGDYGFILANARAFEPIPYRGSLGLFNVPKSVLAGA